MSRRMPRHGLALALAILSAGIAAPAAIAAEGERVLDPVLSLTGGCGTTSVDPVPDPGLCPLEKEGGPGVPGVDHPPSTFSNPRDVTTDDYGNIYVASFGPELGGGTTARIDIFCSDGTFVSELATKGASSLAIDSEGNLYVYKDGEAVVRFAPDVGYDPEPEACEIEYGETPPAMVTELNASYSGLAINRDNDHLFGNFGHMARVVEYSSAAEGNTKVRSVPGPEWGGGAGMAVDAERDRLYASAGFAEERIDIYDLNTVVGTPPDDEYERIGEISPASFPGGNPGTQLAIAVNEGNGNVFVLDNENCRLYEFEADGDYVQTITADFLACTTGGQIAVDNGAESPNGKLSEEAEEGRYLYVPSNRNGIGHSYAFLESIVGPPEVKSIGAENVSEEEAVLRAEIDPNNLPTAYSFEYKAAGASSWTTAGGGSLPTGNDGVEVSAAATGLSPGTSYLFRVVATNEEAEGEAAAIAEASFTTYPSVATEPSPCANALLRTGASASLPDCRAYELVTPGDTNARAPLGPRFIQNNFTSRLVSRAGDKVPFRVEGGALPGLGGTGSLSGDPYLATRTSEGWSTAYTGPSSAEATAVVAGGISRDQGHSFYIAADRGPAVLSPNTGYVRYPDGHSELIGQGSLGKIDPEALGQWISDGGNHVVFVTGGLASTPVQLEPDAAPDGTNAVYDRTPDGVTHVVSLKPGDAPFGAGEDADFVGSSFDGTGIVFRVAGSLYLRYDNEETFEIGSGIEFAGVAEGGEQVFYMDGGDLKRFDALAPEGERVTEFTDTGDAIAATVASQGTVAYFVSETAIPESGPNPEGDSPETGAQNLYRSAEGQIDFVATVTERDVEGSSTGRKADGLGLWVGALQPPAPQGALGLVPARSTPDGDAFLFKSRAALTDYDPEGHAQIYRYAPGELQCLSCIPTGAPPSSDAALQSEERDGAGTLMSPLAWPENLRADGRRAFFESSEALVARDADGRRDVYEWEDQGVGSCTRPQGCVYLISSPKSRRGEYLWAVSESGDDVFFLSSDLLVGSDADETPSIYDARVGGGFAESRVAAECLGEACQPSVSAPRQSGLASNTFVGPEGAPGPATRPCSQGRRKAKRLADRAKRLRRAARRTSAPRASRQLRRKAARNARQARRLTRKAKRCRQQRRRAQR